MADIITYRPGQGKGYISDLPETDLDPNDSLFIDNFIIRNGEIRSWPTFNTNGLPSTFGFGHILAIGAFQLTTLQAKKTVVLGADGKFYQYNDSTGVLDLKGTASVAPIGAPTDFVIYNAVIYFTSGNALYSWDGTTFTNPVANSFGSRWCDKLGQHLVLTHTIEGVGSTAFPYRFRWSGSGAPINWNPAIDLTAGFNDLDTAGLTGFANNGTFGILFSENSITQVNPTGSGQNPFQFLPYTGSSHHNGIGNKWAYSMDSDGTHTFFVSEYDVHHMTVYGLEDIGGSAKNKIFNDIYNMSPGGSGSAIASWSPYYDNTPSSTFPLIIGSYIPYIDNTFIYPCYILAIPQGAQGVNTDTTQTILWIYSLKDKSWTRRAINGWLTNRIVATLFAANSASNNESTFYKTLLTVVSGGALP